MSPKTDCVPFDQVVDRLMGKIKWWFHGPRQNAPDLNDISDSVFLKNREGIFTYANQVFLNEFADGKFIVGKRCDSFLHDSIASTCLRTDSLVQECVDNLWFEHQGVRADGDKYLLRSFKCSLTNSTDESFSILGLTRIIARLDSEIASHADSVEAKFDLFNELSAQDKAICRKYSDGRSTREIASSFDLSTKAIENRRRKILNHLRVATPLDLVKLFVRFEERGHVAMHHQFDFVR